MTLTEATEKIRANQTRIKKLVDDWTRGDGKALHDMLGHIVQLSEDTKDACGELTDEIERLKETNK